MQETSTEKKLNAMLGELKQTVLKYVDPNTLVSITLSRHNQRNSVNVQIGEEAHLEISVRLEETHTDRGGVVISAITPAKEK